MPSSSSIFPMPMERPPPKSTLNRTARSFVILSPWGSLRHGQSDRRLRCAAQLQEEAPGTREIEFDDLTRCVATVQSLIVLDGGEFSIRGHIDPHRCIHRNTVVARGLELEPGEAGVRAVR